MFFLVVQLGAQLEVIFGGRMGRYVERRCMLVKQLVARYGVMVESIILEFVIELEKVERACLGMVLVSLVSNGMFGLYDLRNFVKR